MNVLSLDTRVRQRPGQITAEADGEVLMMDPDTGSYFGLNEVASFIWHRLAEPRSLAELCRAIMAEFEVAEDACARDVLQFVQGMLRDGLLERVETVAPTPGGG